MNTFSRKLITEWRKLKLPVKGETFVVGVSGGADSLGLLFSLLELKKLKKLEVEFITAHFNHNLRGDESLNDARFVEEFAEKNECRFVLGEGKIPEKGNLEQNARQHRYKFLFETAEKYQSFGLLTAHTLNDQAETFLLNMIRGSGISGLSAMKTIREVGEQHRFLLIRPLLSWAFRSEIEEFCRKNKVAFRQDAMNDDLTYSRVRVRKQLLPLLESFNPKIAETLAKTSFLLQNDLEDLTENDKEPSVNPQIKDLKTMSKSNLRRTLRSWLEKQRGDLRRLSFRNLEALEKLIFSEKSGQKVELPNGETVQKREGKLFFQKKG